MSPRKHEYVRYRLDKAEEIFQDAVLLSKNARWNSSVNRLYYSSFHLAGALLYLHDIGAQTHNGVKTQLFLNFVKTGRISRENGKLYAHLHDWRQEMSDYADFVEFTREDVRPLIDAVGVLNNELRSLYLE